MKPEIEKELLEVSRQARLHAHSPYSQYKVGAAVLMDDGKIYPGCNVENASYGATICAERVAITSAVAQGAKKLKAIAIATDEDQPWAPCGVCRQVMLEFSESDTPVLLTNLEGKTQKLSIAELCPYPFKL